jgi:hypothetical protein
LHPDDVADHLVDVVSPTTSDQARAVETKLEVRSRAISLKLAEVIGTDSIAESWTFENVVAISCPS